MKHRERFIYPVRADSSTSATGFIPEFAPHKVRKRDRGKPSQREIPTCLLWCYVDASTADWQIAFEHYNQYFQIGILSLNANHKPSDMVDEDKSLQLSETHKRRRKRKKEQDSQSNKPLGYFPSTQQP